VYSQTFTLAPADRGFTDGCSAGEARIGHAATLVCEMAYLARVARVFRDESLREILAFVTAQIARDGSVELAVADPDRGRGRYAGERLDGGGRHRPWRVWIDLADRLGLRMATPRTAEGLVLLRFEALDLGPGRSAAPDGPPTADDPERYGAGSEFARIAKLEDPGFVIDLREALARAALPGDARVLDLGVNSGDELELVLEAAPGAQITGVDHAASALAVAGARFPGARFVAADLAALPTLSLGQFDLVLSIGTLQSGALDDRAVLRQAVQHHLAPAGSIILGIPNCRYVAGELAHGARMRNFAQPELGLVIKDIAFYRKYLQQHHRQVFVTGKHYLFVTGVPA
jgi:2-polyprenyl-3-methyl-5-hydroxy-6-metoxy-1,4-benzoquinol methylase